MAAPTTAPPPAAAPVCSSERFFSYAGTTSRFFRRDKKFYVHTDGPDGKLADYAIGYTFGVSPLQQYLMPRPDLSVSLGTEA